jgi:NDP-sugar pyrophosphorylase family protein
MLDVIILAGGQGNRMASELPKPLIEVKGKPILFHQIDFLAGKVENIILSLGHKAELIEQAVREHYPIDVHIAFAREAQPAGTAGGLKQALVHARTSYVLVLNCDDLADIPIQQLEQLQHNAICVAHPTLPFGLVEEKDGYAVFREKPQLDSWVSCGWYLFNREELLKILPDQGSLEYDVFPHLKLRLFKHEGFWVPLNTKKDILEFEKK